MAQIQVKLKRLIKEEEDEADDVVSEAVLGVTNRARDLISEEDIDKQTTYSQPERPSRMEWVHALLRPIPSSSLGRFTRLLVDCLYEYVCCLLPIQMPLQCVGNPPRQLPSPPVVSSASFLSETG